MDLLGPPLVQTQLLKVLSSIFSIDVIPKSSEKLL